MITKEIIDQYKPQRMLLVQGADTAFATLEAELRPLYENLHTLCVSRFTIDHARIVAAFAGEGSGSERILLVYFVFFSTEAAQVLLKSIEEPDQQTTIIFITPYPYTVPITIRSRVALIQHVQTILSTQHYTSSELVTYIKKELSSDSIEDASARKALAITLLDQLELQWKAIPQKARVIYEAKHMLLHANLPTKYVLEYVASATA